MAKKKKKENKLLRILLIIITICYGLYISEIEETYSLDPNQTNNILTVTYLDVGQADSILIENNNEYMLIDAGNNDDGPLLVKYFKEKNITTFKYLIGTHPHEDHIGGLDDVINNFNINTIYMPDVITTTKTFLDVLDSIENNNLTYKVPKIEEKFTLGDATLEVLYTGVDTKDLNNTSIVLRLDYKNTSFLFTGDATDITEKILLKKKQNLKVDVLKVGHHGSKYSTTTDFLNATNPKYAIISVGKNNTYNHPDTKTINKLNKYNIETHRTDNEETIIITSDGNNIEIKNINTNTNG